MDAEFAIPLDFLRFPRAPTQEWGFFVRRTIHRTHQVFDSTLVPRSANGLVSRFGTLTGLDDLVPHRAFQLTPYATARLQLRPQIMDPVYPTPRLVEPSADVGADLRVGLTSDLTLNAAINPDFGQVEADQVVLNLSNQELFFPEKRPFFTQGLELFQPVGAEFQTPMQLFYSRRDRSRRSHPRRGEGDRHRVEGARRRHPRRGGDGQGGPGQEGRGVPRRPRPRRRVESTRWRARPTGGCSSTSSSRSTSA